MTTHTTMKRLKGFDYRKPYFYMVTLKRVKGLQMFCEITKEVEPPKDMQGRPRYLVVNAITEAFARVICEFHKKWWGLWPIECFIVMPDHFHLLIHIKDTGNQLALGKYIYQIMKALTDAYWRVVKMDGEALNYQRGVLPVPSGNNSPIFERDWHDWIVKKMVS